MITPILGPNPNKPMETRSSMAVLKNVVAAIGITLLLLTIWVTAIPLIVPLIILGIAILLC
jgi:hypothetical protein